MLAGIATGSVIRPPSPVRNPDVPHLVTCQFTKLLHAFITSPPFLFRYSAPYSSADNVPGNPFKDFS